MVSSGANISIERAETLMDKLCSVNLAQCADIMTKKGKIKLYMYHNETVFFPMLCAAKELMDTNVIHWRLWFERYSTLF